jgi:hypothetical protein
MGRGRSSLTRYGWCRHWRAPNIMAACFFQPRAFSSCAEPERRRASALSREPSCSGNVKVETRLGSVEAHSVRLRSEAPRETVYEHCREGKASTRRKAREPNAASVKDTGDKAPFTSNSHQSSTRATCLLLRDFRRLIIQPNLTLTNMDDDETLVSQPSKAA